MEIRGASYGRFVLVDRDDRVVGTSSQLLVIWACASTRMAFDVGPRSRPIPRESNSVSTFWLTIDCLVAGHLSLMVFLEPAPTLD